MITEDEMITKAEIMLLERRDQELAEAETRFPDNLPEAKDVIRLGTDLSMVLIRHLIRSRGDPHKTVGVHICALGDLLGRCLNKMYEEDNALGASLTEDTVIMLSEVGGLKKAVDAGHSKT